MGKYTIPQKTLSESLVVWPMRFVDGQMKNHVDSYCHCSIVFTGVVLRHGDRTLTIHQYAEEELKGHLQEVNVDC